MDNEMRELILDTIFEAGHHDSLLNVLRRAADEIGQPEVVAQACVAMEFEPREV